MNIPIQDYFIFSYGSAVPDNDRDAVKKTNMLANPATHFKVELKFSQVGNTPQV